MMADWLQSHRDVAQQFQSAMLEVARWGNSNRAQADRILEKYTERRQLRSQKRATYAEHLDEGLLRPVLDARRNMGSCNLKCGPRLCSRSLKPRPTIVFCVLVHLAKRHEGRMTTTALTRTTRLCYDFSKSEGRPTDPCASNSGDDPTPHGGPQRCVSRVVSALNESPLRPCANNARGFII
jgi:hypothetical protein